VTNGEVGFVDNQGASAYRNYRLVADLDNLAVQYNTVADLDYRDVANKLRAGIADNQDASKAYQIKL
jgi:hypothetical protein